MKKKYLADLHIHVGISEAGRWIKIPSSRQLTLRNILYTALYEKGLNIVGIIDVLSPLVQADFERLLEEGVLQEISGGGYLYADRLTVLIGGEVETKEAGGGSAHSLLFLPTLADLAELSKELSMYIKNIAMSSQNAHMDLKSLYALALRYQAKIVPAHVFTPFKSIYGNCSSRMKYIFSGDLPNVCAIELGLSADSFMADRVAELHDFSYLANSDAHSLQNIAREFTEFTIAGQPSHEKVFAAMAGTGQGISALYGLNPELGKYHVTRCAKCGRRAEYLSARCVFCKGRVVSGVSERIEEIADLPSEFVRKGRAPYNYHLPLSVLPGIGTKTLEKIRLENLTELFVLYKSSKEDLVACLGEKVAGIILRSRQGEVSLQAGGAGRYGSVLLD